MFKQITTEIPGSAGKKISLDITVPEAQRGFSVVIFAHGFKGFKDWGHFNALAQTWAEEGLLTVKFNFSHNGTTPENQSNFSDLEAFGQNNFEKELDDLDRIIDWVKQELPQLVPQATGNLGLVGHSRGGSLVTLQAAQDERVEALVTWAAVADLDDWMHRFPIAEWEKEGVIYIPNARTKQEMPLYFQFYENYKANIDRFSVAKAASLLTVPHLIVHGTEDAAVPVTAGQQFHQWSVGSQYMEVEGGGHTFGAGHPFGESIPEPALEVVEFTGEFLLSVL